MKSKIFVEHDFDKNEPYLQLSIDAVVPPDQQPDMRDTCLKLFIERASYSKISVVFPSNTIDNSSPQLRIDTIDNTHRLWSNDIVLADWLRDNKIDFEIKEQTFYLAAYVDPFLTGQSYGQYLQSKMKEVK